MHTYKKGKKYKIVGGYFWKGKRILLLSRGPKNFLKEDPFKKGVANDEITRVDTM